MIAKIIISEQEKCFIDIVALVTGEEQQTVEYESQNKFRELIKADNEDLSEEELEDCIQNEFYYNTAKEYGLYLMETTNILEV